MFRSPSLLAVVFVALSSCMVSARPVVRGMAVSPEKVTPANPALAGAVGVGRVTGGTRSLLRPSAIDAAEVEHALTTSLGAAGLLAPTPATARYALTADLLEVDQPFRVQHEEVTTTIRYVLTDRRTGAPVFTRNVEVRYEARGDDSFRTVERSQIAGEGSVRESLETFLDALGRVRVATVEPSPPTGPTPRSVAAPSVQLVPPAEPAPNVEPIPPAEPAGAVEPDAPGRPENSPPVTPHRGGSM